MNPQSWLLLALTVFIVFCFGSMLFMGKGRGRNDKTKSDDRDDPAAQRKDKRLK